jgi:hypothetical protein
VTILSFFDFCITVSGRPTLYEVRAQQFLQCTAFSDVACKSHGVDFRLVEKLLFRTGDRRRFGQVCE